MFRLCQALAQSLSEMLCSVTGYDAFSLQPNSGAQGEYAGLNRYSTLSRFTR